METWLKDKLRGDWQIWFIIVLLSLFSMLVVYSASFALAYKKVGGNTEIYLIKHAGHLILGISTENTKSFTKNLTELGSQPLQRKTH